MSLEEYFRKRRKRNRYTQQQIADFIGVGQSTISRIENDCHNTTWNTIKKVLFCLNDDEKNEEKLINRILKKYYLFSYRNTEYENKNNVENDRVRIFLKTLLKSKKLKKEILKNNPLCFAKKMLRNIGFEELA